MVRVPAELGNIPSLLGESERLDLVSAAQCLQESAAARKKLLRDLGAGQRVDSGTELVVMLAPAFH